MKCPECGKDGAKPVRLFTSISYLCESRGCKFFDKEHAASKINIKSLELSDDLNIDWDFSYADWYPLVDEDLFH